MSRAVHFAPGIDPLLSACGRTWRHGLAFASDPIRATCRTRACREEAQDAVDWLRAAAVRAAGARLVFLDFDGVLNHLDFYRWRIAEREAGRPTPQHFDRVCVARLNRLLERSHALVVISSSWRSGSSVLRMNHLLGSYGFVGDIIGMTPELGRRGGEIRAWLDVLPASPATFVVLDDERVEGFPDHLVLTDHNDGGLTDAKVDEALRMLGVTTEATAVSAREI